MPQFDLAQWRERSSQAFSGDDQNPYAYKLTVYDRKDSVMPASEACPGRL